MLLFIFNAIALFLKLQRYRFCKKLCDSIKISHKIKISDSAEKLLKKFFASVFSVIYRKISLFHTTFIKYERLAAKADLKIF